MSFSSSEAWIYVCDSETGEMSGEDDNGGCVWNLSKGKTYYVLFDAREKGYTVSLRLLEADQPQNPQAPETPGGSGTSGEQGSSEERGRRFHVTMFLRRSPGRAPVPGRMTYQECRLCGMIADQKELPLLAHQYQVVVDKKATCGRGEASMRNARFVMEREKRQPSPLLDNIVLGAIKSQSRRRR